MLDEYLTENYQKLKEIALEEAEIKLETDYISLQESERDIVKQLNEKYGPGTLDPQTGVFTPVEASDEKADES